MTEPLLSIRALAKHFQVRGTGPGRARLAIRAVDGVDLDVMAGETVAVVGESGCGKSTLGRCIVRLERPTSGTIAFQGVSIGSLAGRQLRHLRRGMQMVFQDPGEALDPRIRIGDAVREGLDLQGIGTRSERRASVSDMLGQVGLAATTAARYPHELSGGQQQRVVIARALILRPSLVVADEPVAALDVSVRSQILNLLTEMREAYRLTYLFISHDLNVVRYMSDRIAVMYLGKIVELAPTGEFDTLPLHPYTVSLMSAVLPLHGPESARVILKGEVPSPVDLPSGCRFRTRCPIAQQVCAAQEPPLRPARAGHYVACHFPGEFHGSAMTAVASGHDREPAVSQALVP